MSLIDRIKKDGPQTGVFCVVGAERLGGKSTLAGTLPGKTVFLQAAALETGSKSAVTLAQRNNARLDIVEFNDLSDLLDLLDDPELLSYDNIYLDSISAVSEMKYNEPAIRALIKRDNWAAFREIGNAMTDVILCCKSIAERHNKNVFMTLGYQAKRDANGTLVELLPSCKGNKPISEIKKLCPVVVSLRTTIDSDGQVVRQMITKNDDVYPGRIDTLLDDQNPGVLPADLSLLLELVKGA